MAAKTKVLLIGPYPPPYGGQSVHVQNLQERLLGAGHSCVVLNTGAERKKTIPGCVRIKNIVDFGIKSVYYAARGFRMHVHLNAGSIRSLLPGIIAVFCARLFGTRSFITLHGGSEQVYLLQHNGYRERTIWKLLSGADALICNNESVRMLLSRKGISLEKIVVIPAFSKNSLGTDDEIRNPELERFLQEHPSIVSTTLFFRPEYGVETLLSAVGKAAREKSGFGLVVMGDLAGGKDYVKVIEKLGLTRNVFLSGDLPHAQCLLVIKRSNIFVRATLREGDSNAVREAMALGVPVVASDTGFRPEGVMLFRKGDADDLAMKILTILESTHETGSEKARNQERDFIEEIVRLVSS